ncbi:hypothetical protein H6F75_22370 [Nodosilinea sp. FACHB-131]|uniref:hypothetical protein n=1 Tax=Cyanophyceae TaxID=3028117 RepID=UPI00168809F7|nr:hypothetical protein [Nodosilinea sp. FACHB-131]MBD1876235.1 hypothetical protein [Nodosilinea sp. FACHB-131]
MTYPDGSDLVKRLVRLENQVEALRRVELELCQELVSLFHCGQVTEISAQRILRHLEALKTLKPK